jgi:hypothetical protein
MLPERFISPACLLLSDLALVEFELVEFASFDGGRCPFR